VVAYISKLMHWYATRDENYTSPIVKGMGRNKRSARSRILDDDELRALWEITGGMGPFGVLVRVLLLTAQRRRKVEAMEWTDLVDGTWVIRRSERAKGTPPTLLLAPLVLELIAPLPRIGDQVFAAARWPAHRKPELDRLLKARLGGMPDWVFHDLRRSARSLMARAGGAPDVAERVLGHRVGSQVAQTYDRHGYQAEMGRL
jgi:integrase